MQDFERLYREYYEKVYAFLYRLSSDAAIAEDLAQETFLQAYTSFHRFRGECHVLTWLISIGKHQYFRYLRKHKKNLSFANLEILSQLYADVPEPEDYMTKRHVKETVRRVVDEIPKKYKDVITLRVYAQLPFSQVALALGISENSAKVIYFRAKKMLVEELKHELL